MTNMGEAHAATGSGRARQVFVFQSRRGRALHREAEWFLNSPGPRDLGRRSHKGAEMAFSRRPEKTPL